MNRILFQFRDSGASGLTQHTRFSLAAALFVLLAMASPAPAWGIDTATDALVDILIQAIDPGLAPAKPLVICLTQGKDVQTCLNEQLSGLEAGAKQAAIKQLPFDPSDSRIQEIVKIFNLLRQDRWPEAIASSGDVAGKTIICALQPPGIKTVGCPITSYVIDHQKSVLESLYPAVKKPDWPAVAGILLDEFGPGTVCSLIPSDLLGDAGVLKDAGCSIIAAIFEGAKEFAESTAKLLVSGADAIENAIFGDDSHMPYEQYFHLYWEPWYHLGAKMCTVNNCAGLGALADSIEGPCVDYFDSHNQYRKTAKKTCGDMSAKFEKQVKDFAERMNLAARAHVDRLWPLVQTLAAEDYGKDQVKPKDFFQLNCEVQLKKQFPFPEPDPGRCEIVKAPLAKMTSFTNLFDSSFYKSTVDQIYKSCLSQAAAQMPSPTAWNYSCKLSASDFAAEFNDQKSYLAGHVGDLLKGGCHLKSPTVGSQGVELVCTNYPVYEACLALWAHGAEQQHCQLDQEAADKKIVDMLMAQLGTRRCMVSGKTVACGRPWKIESCKTLRATLTGALVGKTQVQCKGNALALTDFSVKSQKAEEIVAVLNGQAGKQGATIAKKAGPCTQMWDPLALNCGAGKVLDEHPGIELDTCPEDPNRDGADDPCLFKGLLKSQADKALAKQEMTQPGEPVVPATKPQPAQKAIGTTDQQPVAKAVPGGGAVPGAPGSLPEAKTMSTQAQNPVPAESRTAGSEVVAPGSQTPAADCSFDLTYLAPQGPVLETAANRLASGDQVRITCRYAVRTEHVTRAACDDQARRTAQALRAPGAVPARVLSAMVAVDGQLIGVGNVPAGRSDFEKTAIWSFRDAGSHTVSCQIDNPLGTQVRGADQYVSEMIAVEVGTRGDATPATGFDPAKARAVPTRRQASPAALLPEMRGTAPAGHGTVQSSLEGSVKTTQGVRTTGQFSVEGDMPEEEIGAMPVGPGAETQHPDDGSAGGGVGPVMTPGAGTGGQFSPQESVPEDEVNPKQAGQNH